MLLTKEGRLTRRKYTDKNGSERTAIEVIASGMEMLSPKPGAGDTDLTLPELGEAPAPNG